MEDKLVITLHLYDEDIQVKIPREEEACRKAALVITDRYNFYAEKYGMEKSMHTIGLMAALDIALQFQKEKSRNDTEPFLKIMSELTSEINEALSK